MELHMRNLTASLSLAVGDCISKQIQIHILHCSLQGQIADTTCFGLSCPSRLAIHRTDCKSSPRSQFCSGNIRMQFGEIIFGERKGTHNPSLEKLTSSSPTWPPKDFDLLQSAAQDNRRPCASVCLLRGGEG